MLMCVTTVASVTEKNKNENQRKQLLRTLFNRYSLIFPITHHHDPSVTLHINNKRKNAVADAYEAPPQKRDRTRRKQLLRAVFNTYILIRPTIRSPDPISTIYNNDKQQNAAPDT